MKILVLQIEDRDDSFLNKLMKSNQTICQNNDIEYVFLKKSKELVPPYWAKVYELKRLMKEHPHIDYFIWVDSDAFFINFTKERLLNFLEKYNKYTFIGTPDIPPWTEKFNAGVFIIKNNTIGKEIVQKWVTYYHKDVWKYDTQTQKWSTKATWAGEEYEQGSFSKYIMEDPKFSKEIILIPYYYLNNHNCGDHQDETLLVHLAGEYKKNKTNIETCTPKLMSPDLVEGFNSQESNNSYNICRILNISIFFLIIIFILLSCSLIYRKTLKIQNLKIQNLKIQKLKIQK
jgi:hypothetical protein